MLQKHELESYHFWSLYFHGNSMPMIFLSESSSELRWFHWKTLTLSLAVETIQKDCHPPPPQTKQNTTYRLMVKSITINISIFQLATFFQCTKHHLWVSFMLGPTWRQAFCSLRASCSNCWSCKRLGWQFLGMPNWLVVEPTHLNNMLVKGEIFPNFSGWRFQKIFETNTYS